MGKGWKAARPAADRDERESRLSRRVAGSQGATIVDWVTEIIRTMIGRGDDARLVERFFLAGRLSDIDIVNFVFRERAKR